MSEHILTATKARANLFRLIEQVNQEHQPVVITGKKADAVLLSIEDWRAIEETLYLTSIPGMAESIKEGLKTPLNKCVEDLDW